MKTLAFSDSAVAFWFSCAGAKHNHKKGHREESSNDDAALLMGTSGDRGEFYAYSDNSCTRQPTLLFNCWRADRKVQ
jgi:hypothetical protein